MTMEKHVRLFVLFVSVKLQAGHTDPAPPTKTPPAAPPAAEGRTPQQTSRDRATCLNGSQTYLLSEKAGGHNVVAD